MTFKYIYDLSLLFEMSSVYTITKCFKMFKNEERIRYATPCFLPKQKEQKKNVFNLVQIYWNILNVPRASKKNPQCYNL